MSQPLSPAAQAAVDAWAAAKRNQARTAGRYEAHAAFLCAVADQVIDERCQNESEKRIYDRLCRLAAELEGSDG